MDHSHDVDAPTPDHDALIGVVAAETARAVAVLRQVDATAPVPSAPDWTAADLAWHLAQVQTFWGRVVADLLTDVEDHGEPERPAGAPMAALVDDLAAAGEALVAALRRRDPVDPCWSWYAAGRSVGWVARRQAHEALIHRVDAELAAGVDVVEATPALAVDGIDEIATVMLDLPGWGTFTPDRTSVRVDATDTGAVTTFRLGRFVGTSPDTGTAYDIEAARRAGLDGPAQVGATVYGTAWELDRWLWGRLPLDDLDVEGDVDAVHRLRTALEID